MEADFECTVCHGLLYQPVALACGHAFCKGCLECTFRYVRAPTPTGCSAPAARPRQRAALADAPVCPSARSSPQDDKCPLCRTPLLLPPTGGASSRGASDVSFSSGLRVCLPLAELLAATFPAETAARAADELRLTASGPVLPAAVCLDLFILDCTLPGQALHLNVYEPRYLRLCHRLLQRERDGAPVGDRLFGMVGYEPARSPPMAAYGVACTLSNAQRTFEGRILVTARALRRFKICRSWSEPAGADADGARRHAHAGARPDGSGGLVRAIVEYIDDDDAEDAADGSAARASALAVEVASACRAWCVLVRGGGWERTAGQLDALLSAQQPGGLGPMPEPTAERAAELSWWAAALVNPLPPLGVAPEIRPQALAARSAEARLALVLRALEESSAFLQTPPRALAFARAAERVLLRPVGALHRAAAALLALTQRWWALRQARRCVGALCVVVALVGGQRACAGAFDALAGERTGGLGVEAFGAVLAALRL